MGKSASGLSAGDAAAAIAHCSVAPGDTAVFENGEFVLDPLKEKHLVAYLKHAELFQSRPVSDEDGSVKFFMPSPHFPLHERTVDIHINLGLGSSQTVVVGADLTHEYVTENADYRS